MSVIEWGLFAILGAIGLSCILVNYLLLGRQILAKPGQKVPSFVPFVGGILGFFAVRIFFDLKFELRQDWLGYALLPAALDPGFYLLYFLIMPLVWKLRGYSK
jgi:hypothetical protein